MKQAILLVCGGIHPSSYTGQMVATIAQDAVLNQLSTVVYTPQSTAAVLSAFALKTSVDQALRSQSQACDSDPALLIWAFSAGCVGATALAAYWQRYRGQVLALFMVDGWGVPRDPRVPGHRLSHDRFTHDTCRWLGAGETDFYADPGVPHLQLWQHPQATEGWAIAPGQSPQRLSAAEFLCQRSRDYLTLG